MPNYSPIDNYSDPLKLEVRLRISLGIYIDESSVEHFIEHLDDMHI